MNEAMRVSVLLPFRDAEDSLEQAVQSVIAQNEPNMLILVMNQEESAAAAHIMKRYAGAQIQLIQEVRRGIVPALNAGLRVVQTPYVARMDADDIMLPGRLSAQCDFLDAHPTVHMVNGKVRYEGNSALHQGYKMFVEQINALNTPEQLYNFRFTESPFVHPAVCFRFEEQYRTGLYREGDFPEDYALWLQWFAEKGPQMAASLPQEVLCWVDSLKRLSRSHPAYSAEAFDSLRLPYLAAWLNAAVLSQRPIIIAGGGKLAKRKIRKLQALGVAIAAFSDLIPRKIEGLPFILWSELPQAGKYFVVSLVSNRNSRYAIAEALESKGYREGYDFILAG
jgi:glycosyltransferase involved in cell wall biosynthesis